MKFYNNTGPFCYYKNVQLGQTHKTLEFFSEFIKDFDTILELGFHRGGLSLWLNDHKREDANLYCYDITSEYLQTNETVNFIISDLFSEKTIQTIYQIIKKGKRTLVLCDGGDKQKEFEIYSKFLKVNDVIMLHDFCEHGDEYNFFASQVGWPSPAESFYDKIEEFIINSNLKPFNYDKLKSCFWGSFIKEYQPKLSILICSLIERNKTFLPNLLDTLNLQIQDKPVEVLILSDNACRPVGTKRNDMINLSNGEYICFIDDDDRVSDDYIDLILKEIEDSNTDVVVFNAEISFDGINPKLVRYGKEFDYCEKEDAYYRHPNHLMVHKKSNIKEFFKDVKFGEDDEWAFRQLQNIQTQRRIEKVLYFYDYKTTTKKYY